MPHVFLSDDWLDEVRSIAGDASVADSASTLKINFTITGGPEGDKDLHVAGGMSPSSFQKGHMQDAPTTITVPFDIAKKLIVDADLQVVMQAFMNGQIKIDGDMSQLMAMQGSLSAPDSALVEKVKAVTA